MADTVDAEGLSLGVDEDGVPLVLLPSGAPLPLVRRLTVEANLDDAVLLKIEVIACRPRAGG